MKILSLIPILGSLFCLPSIAQGPIMVNCDFSKSFAPSEKLAELTHSKNMVAHCTGNDQTFEIAFIGVKFTTNSDEFRKVSTIDLRCTGNAADGVYTFGGYPIGFPTPGSPKSPWFYKHEGGGRCFLEYSSQAITSVEAVVNQSQMFLLEVESI